MTNRKIKINETHKINHLVIIATDFVLNLSEYFASPEANWKKLCKESN